MFIEENEEANKEFMKLVDTQIPISSKNWVNFDFAETLKMISTSLSSKDVSELKYNINNIKTDADILMAPFCILMGEKSTRVKKADGQVKEIWN